MVNGDNGDNGDNGGNGDGDGDGPGDGGRRSAIGGLRSAVVVGLVARGRGPSFVGRRSLLGLSPARSTLEGGRRIRSRAFECTNRRSI